MNAIPSSHAASIVGLLDGLDQQKGDLSFRMEGMCRVISLVAPWFNEHDKADIAGAIVRCCKMFNQVDKEGMPTNRYATQTLQDLKL